MASKSVLSNNGNVSSGIIVDREKQRNVPAVATAKNKRCRFADDQAHIVQSTASNDRQR
jgi:hypothetical protein